jgi:hypothetical protein
MNQSIIYLDDPSPDIRCLALGEKQYCMPCGKKLFLLATYCCSTNDASKAAAVGGSSGDGVVGYTECQDILPIAGSYGFYSS